FLMTPRLWRDRALALSAVQVSDISKHRFSRFSLYDTCVSPLKIYDTYYKIKSYALGQANQFGETPNGRNPETEDVGRAQTIIPTAGGGNEMGDTRQCEGRPGRLSLAHSHIC